MSDEELRRQIDATVSTFIRVGESVLRTGEALLEALADEARRASEAGELTAEQLVRCREVGMLPTPAPHELN